MAKNYKRYESAKRSTVRQLSAEENIKVPKLMDGVGLTKGVLIQRYLIPLLSAKTTIHVRENGTFRRVSIRDNSTRQRALDMAFKLVGAYAQTNLKLAKANSNDDIDIIDIPSHPKGIHIIRASSNLKKKI